MEIKLGEYNKFGFERPNVTVSDDEINDYCDKIRQRYKIEVEKEGHIENGDYVVIEFVGYHNGESVPQLSSKQHHSKIGEGFLIKEFEDSILGKKKSDVVEVDIVLPEDSTIKHLIGEKVHFEIKIISVMELIIPELTDNMVRNFKIEGIDTISKLNEYAEDNIYYEKMMFESINVINKIISRIIESSTVLLEDEEVNSLKEEIFEDFKKQLEKRNSNLQIYLSYANKTEEELIKQCKLEAQTYLTEKAIIEKIAEIESITLNDEEIEKYKNTEEQDFLNQLLYKKVIYFLLKENTIIMK